MQLATIKNSSKEPSFGLIKDGFFYCIAQLQKSAFAFSIDSLESFFQNYTKNYALLRAIVAEADFASIDGIPLKECKFSPVLQQPHMIIDFALTPQHLENSAATFIEHEYSGLKKLIAKKVMKGKVDKMKQAKDYPYYIGNTGAVSGPDDTLFWPSYSSYLDIEPELAFIVGDEQTPVAGYTILNDVSARDVQVPELNSLSLTRSKHFDKSNGLGPIFTTADEIYDFRSLGVEVKIGERLHWKGSTENYSASPDEVITYLSSFLDLKPGTVIGLGTIPYCCGLDNNEWIRPNESIEIQFSKLGTLRQHTPSKPEIIGASRWAERKLN